MDKREKGMLKILENDFENEEDKERLHKLWRLSLITWNNDESDKGYKRFLKFIGAKVYLDNKTGKYKVIWEKV